MTNIQELRSRAVELFIEHADRSRVISVDYAIDKYLRSVFDLPDLPSGHEPYTGWIVGLPTEPTKLTISALGIGLIKRWEGLRLSAYQCSAHVWTIGWGHTQGVSKGDRINRRQAEKYFLEDIKVFENAVNRIITVDLKQNQFDALVSFCFNVGERQFANSTLVDLLNQGLYEVAALEFHRWVFADGRKIEGLVKRRREESALFTS